MTSPAIATIVKMLESLPDDLQERVFEHIREFIADIENEKRWDASFERTQDTLVAAALKAKQEIVAGQSVQWTTRNYEVCDVTASTHESQQRNNSVMESAATIAKLWRSILKPGCIVIRTATKTLE
jgi:hypothetical protein